jgi:hypothetical protein
MENSFASHPSDDQIEALLLGRVTSVLSDRIEMHCFACQNCVEKLEDEEQFLIVLRSALRCNQINDLAPSRTTYISRIRRSHSAREQWLGSKEARLGRLQRHSCLWLCLGSGIRGERQGPCTDATHPDFSCSTCGARLIYRCSQPYCGRAGISGSGKTTCSNVETRAEGIS